MIVRITENKKRFLNLLLLADEQESMINRYLERGEMFVLYKKEIPVAACVITDEGDNVCEIKNIAVLPQYQRQGYGRRLIDFLFERYKKSYRVMLVGTGDTFSTISFAVNPYLANNSFGVPDSPKQSFIPTFLTTTG